MSLQVRLSWWVRFKLFFALLWVRYFSRKRHRFVSPYFEHDDDGNITRFRNVTLGPGPNAFKLPHWRDVDALRARANRFHRRAQRAEGRGLAEQHRQIRQLEDRLAKTLDAGRNRLRRTLDDAHGVIQANHRLQAQIDDLRKNGSTIAPASDTHCGDCPRVLPGPEQDFCNLHGDLLVYVGREKGSYVRLDKCRTSKADTEWRPITVLTLEVILHHHRWLIRDSRGIAELRTLSSNWDLQREEIGIPMSMERDKPGQYTCRPVDLECVPIRWSEVDL